MCTTEGAGVVFQPYCGRDTRIDDFGLGQGPNVVLSLTDMARLAPGSEIYFDNLFTSFPLLERLSEMQIGGTGTVRQNRLNRVPIIAKKDLEKKDVPRGTSDRLHKGDQTLVAWKDSKAVYMASNMHGASSNNTCKRFDRVQRKSVQVSCTVFLFLFVFVIVFVLVFIFVFSICICNCIHICNCICISICIRISICIQYLYL
jgi:hypothetical protein